ncbi:MAG: hypothetical protein ABI602_04745 [Candidatus Saccharibacteria bacterium]
MEKAYSPDSLETYQAEVFDRLSRHLGSIEFSQLGKLCMGSGTVRESRTKTIGRYNCPAFHELQTTRYFLGTVKETTHNYLIYWPLGGGGEGKSADFLTYFDIDIVAQTLSINQYVGGQASSRDLAESYAHFRLQDAPPVQQWQQLAELIASYEDTATASLV